MNGGSTPRPAFVHPARAQWRREVAGKFCHCEGLIRGTPPPRPYPPDPPNPAQLQTKSRNGESETAIPFNVPMWAGPSSEPLPDPYPALAARKRRGPLGPLGPGQVGRNQGPLFPLPPSTLATAKTPPPCYGSSSAAQETRAWEGDVLGAGERAGFPRLGACLRLSLCVCGVCVSIRCARTDVWVTGGARHALGS